jgi:hypothetical protein
MSHTSHNVFNCCITTLAANHTVAYIVRADHHTADDTPGMTKQLVRKVTTAQRVSAKPAGECIKQRGTANCCRQLATNGRCHTTATPPQIIHAAVNAAQQHGYSKHTARRHVLQQVSTVLMDSPHQWLASCCFHFIITGKHVLVRHTSIPRCRAIHEPATQATAVACGRCCCCCKDLHFCPSLCRAVCCCFRAPAVHTTA